MLRALIAAGLALHSIGCAAETSVADPGDPPCGWMVVALASYDGDPDLCEWSVRSLDTQVARLRSVAGVPSDAVPLCEIETFGQIGALRPTELVEIWSSPEYAHEAASMVEIGACE